MIWIVFWSKCNLCAEFECRLLEVRIINFVNFYCTMRLSLVVGCVQSWAKILQVHTTYTNLEIKYIPQGLGNKTKRFPLKDRSKEAETCQPCHGLGSQTIMSPTSWEYFHNPSSHQGFLLNTTKWGIWQPWFSTLLAVSLLALEGCGDQGGPAAGPVFGKQEVELVVDAHELDVW